MLALARTKMEPWSPAQFVEQLESLTGTALRALNGAAPVPATRNTFGPDKRGLFSNSRLPGHPRAPCQDPLPASASIGGNALERAATVFAEVDIVL